MRQREVWYKILTENALDAIYIISASKGFEYINPAFERILGYSSAEVCRQGFDFLRLVYPSDRAMIARRQHARLKRINIPSMYEFRVITREGQIKYVEVNTVPLPGKAGRVLGILRDISDRKLIEKRLESSRRRLAAGQKELRQFSHRMLSVREEERKNLSAIMHDEVGSMAIWLNSVFSTIEQGIRKRNWNEALKTIIQSKQAVKNLTSRLKSIAAKLRPPDLEITGLPEALREYCLELSNATNLTINFRDEMRPNIIDDGVGIILYRIVQEATNNIVKHARARRVEVSLSSWREGVKLVIKDDGKGFFMGKKGKHTKNQMGLLGMKEMAESLGGTFHLATRPGLGTAVAVSLPSLTRPPR